MRVGSWGAIVTFTFLALKTFYLYFCFCGVCACMHTHARECRRRCKDVRSPGARVLQAGVLETKLARAVGSINCGAIFPVPHFIFFNRNNLGSYWLILSRQMSPTDHSWYWLQCEGRKTFPVQIRIVSISCLTIPVRAVTVAQNCSPQLCYFSIKTTIGKKNVC